MTDERRVKSCGFPSSSYWKCRSDLPEFDEPGMKPGSYWEMPYSGGSRVVLVEILTSDERAADVLHLPRGDPGQAENESDGRADKHGVQQGRSLKDGDREACVARCHRNQQQANCERMEEHSVQIQLDSSRITNHRYSTRCSREHQMK